MTEGHAGLDADDVVFAIADNDRMVHAGRAAAVARHWDESRPVPSGIAFHDEHGCGLTLVTATDETAAGFVGDGSPEPGPAARMLLADRILAGLAAAQVVRDRELAAPGGDSGSGPARVPLVTGELPDVVRALAALDDAGSHADTDPGGWFHGLWHATFG